MMSSFSLLFLLLSSSFTSSIFGPPKLLEQPPEEVWFQPGGDTLAAKFTLKCIASDNADKYIWMKNGGALSVEGEISWQKAGQTGSLLFTRPGPHHIGYYQCFVSNIYGTAVSNRVHVQLGVLEHFSPRETETVEVEEGESLSLQCSTPFGHPAPTIFWLYRDTEQDSVIETIRRPHIATDAQGRLHFKAVTAHDARPTLVYECAATSPVLHGEYRAGDRIQLAVKKSPISPRIVPAKELYLSPTQVILKAGNRLKLQCIIGGLPIPKISWSRDRAELPKERMKDLTSAESDFGASLVLDPIHPEDAGIYVCRSHNIVHSMNVSVEAAPFWEKTPPSDVELAEGETASLMCLAGGNPPPLIRWTMNGKPLHEVTSSTRHLFLLNGRLLQIKNLDHDLDTAVYQCNASNPRGYVYANAFVHVLAHAPRFLMAAHRVWKAVLHSTVNMNCEVDSAPAATISWVDADDRPIPVLQGKSSILSNHTFTIMDVNSADEGLFYCNVSNKYGINRATNILQVYKSTYFTHVPSPQKLWVDAGQRVQVECEAISDERLALTYNWTIRGRPIQEVKAFQLDGRRLTLPSARGWHSGSIQCTAITEVDTKVASMHLTVRDVPEWPAVSRIVCNERKATIEWDKPDEHADPILKYIVEMHSDFNMGEWKTVFEDEDVQKSAYTVDIILSPWVNYTFRVAAINSHGRSEAAAMEGEKVAAASCKTRASFPYSNPSAVHAEGTQPDNLLVHWKPLAKVDWNAPQLQYLIRYRLHEAGVAWTEFIVEDSFASQTTIRELPTFRKFEVQVRAVNAIGPSIVEPETVMGYSGEDTPTLAPQHFIVEGIVNLTTVKFSWIPVDAKSMRGHMKGYVIEYWPTSRGRASSKRELVPAASTHLIPSLKSCTNYSAVIRPRNKKYVGPESQILHFETPEGIPSRVSDLRVRPVGAHSILVSWSSPAEPNGILRGYFLTFTGEKNETEETYVLHRQMHYLHENSEADSGYRVSVWGETAAGEGPRALKAIRTWPLRAPDQPRFILVNSTETEADFEWMPNDGLVWRMPGSAFLLNYTLDGIHFQQTLPIVLPSTKISITGLTPNTRYSVFGVAREGNLSSSREEPIIVLTATSESRSHLNQESVRSALWMVAVLVAVSIALVAVLITRCCESRRSGGYSVRRKEMEIGHQVERDEERNFLEYQYGFK